METNHKSCINKLFIYNLPDVYSTLETILGSDMMDNVKTLVGTKTHTNKLKAECFMLSFFFAILANYDFFIVKTLITWLNLFVNIYSCTFNL